MSQSGFSLYKAIIKPLRDADETKMLDRFMGGPQAQHDLSETTILSLRDQIKPDKVRSELLQHLMPLVGFTSELRSITERLTTEQLRRLVNLAVPLWNQRHTKSGLINGIRLLTGRTAIVSTWFTFRAILDEVTLTEDQLVQGGDFWIIGGSISTYDEFWSNIRVMDDGTLDEILLIDICRLMRPMDERFEVFINDFMDHFDGTLDGWTNMSGDSIPHNGFIDTGTYPNTLSLLRELSPIIPLWIADPSVRHDYNITFKFLFPDATSFFSIRWYVPTAGSGTSYQLQLNPANGRGTLIRNNPGASTIQASGLWPTACKFVVGVWYTLRISIANIDSTTRSIRVLVDGNQAVPANPLLTELIDSPGATPNIGDIILENTGSSVVQIDNVEVWRNPPRFATITISTITERGGHVEMSPNFVQ